MGGGGGSALCWHMNLIQMSTLWLCVSQVLADEAGAASSAAVAQASISVSNVKKQPTTAAFFK